MADPRICQKCGSPVPIRSPESLCPRCMLMVGLGNGSESSLPEDNPETLVHTAPGKSVLETIGHDWRCPPRAFARHCRGRATFAYRSACGRNGTHTSLPNRRRDRPRRHGDRLEGQRRRPRPRRCDQGVARRPPRQRRTGPPVRRGSADRRPVTASGDGADLRAGDIRRQAAVFQHEAGERADVGRPARRPFGTGGRVAPAAVDLRGHRANDGLCAYARRDPSRLEALQRDGGQLRRGPGDGLGPGQGFGSRRCRR